MMALLKSKIFISTIVFFCIFRHNTSCYSSCQDKDSTNRLRISFIKKGHFQLNSLQGYSYAKLSDSNNNAQWISTSYGTSLFFEYTFLDRLNIGVGMSVSYSKYHFTFNRACVNEQIYLKYFPPFGQKEDGLKFLKNTFFFALGFGRGKEYPTPLRGEVFANNMSVYLGVGFSIVPKKLFHRQNKHWGFDFMWYTPNIVLFKDHSTANPGGIGVKYIW